MGDGGWISLVNLENGKKPWASPVELGAHEIVLDKVSVKASDHLSGDKLRDLALGTYVQVVETKVVQQASRVRGRLADGGWISLVNLENGKKPWASPVELGAHEIVLDK